jgi:hypothetical protein
VLTPDEVESGALQVKVTMNCQGDIQSMIHNWTADEMQRMRRLVLMSWTQQYNHLSVSFQPLPARDYIPGMPVLSCIYCKEVDRHFVTSVDVISLLEQLVRARFPVQEKNRIRRNLQSLKPLTVSKSSPKLHNFFELIMDYDSPKPRHVEKDVKVLFWSSVEAAIAKVLSKYIVDPSLGPSGRKSSLDHLQSLQHVQAESQTHETSLSQSLGYSDSIYTSLQPVEFPNYTQTSSLHDYYDETHYSPLPSMPLQYQYNYYPQPTETKVVYHSDDEPQKEYLF